MSGFDLLWLLLPVAAGVGWWTGRNAVNDGNRKKEADRRFRRFRSDYSRGINYLINEQPERAIDIFIEYLEVDAETVETHLALGNLYRRRGDHERAIHIHENIISRTSLSAGQRTEAKMELAHDYSSAGLFDRAEAIFKELTEVHGYRVQALKQLVDIYEHERDWAQAIVSAQQLELATGDPLGTIIAHYYCERAVRFQEERRFEKALEDLRRARETHDSCVRASLIEADIHTTLGDHRSAIRALQRVESQDPEFIPETIGPLHRSFAALGQADALQEYLSRLHERYGWSSVLLALAAIRQESDGPREAIRFIGDRLRRRISVRGLDRMLELEIDECRRLGDEPGSRVEMLKGLTEGLLLDRPIYRCERCGFPAKSLHWQCPSCKRWTTIKPIRGVEGE